MFCTACGSPVDATARFCQNCGNPLTPPTSASAGQPAAPPDEIRKVVSIIFCDVVDSTALGERVDPESVRRVMALYFDEMRRVIERHGGVVEKFIGDAVMAVFGVPQLHEDDAVRAARAAYEMSTTLADLNEELEAGWGVRIRNRTGVNTGEVVTTSSVSNQRMVTGDAVNTAARLEQHAQPGQILLGEATYRLARDAVTASPVAPLTVKGKTEPLPAWELTAVTTDAPWLQRHLDSPMVGRARDLAVVEHVFDDCLVGSCRVVTLVAPPGFGKSRVVHEVAARLGDRARVTVGRCLSYGDGVTYWPLAQVVKDLVGAAAVDDPATTRERLAGTVADIGPGGDGEAIVHALSGALGLDDSSAPTTEIAWAARRLFEVVAQREPLVVVFDDIHWAEPAFLDLLEHVGTLTSGVPLMLICLARPELEETRPGWDSSLPGAVRVTLGPLSVDETNALLDNLLDGAPLPLSVRERIVRTADGNPLFVEELLRMFIDDRLLVRSGDGWEPTRDVDELVVPESISAILSTRLDRLAPAERAYVHAAAVVGQEFYREALLEMVDVRWRESVESALRSLVEKQFVRPVGTGFAGTGEFGFSHILVRESAYASISRESRADLHERFAGWLEATAGPSTGEYAEIVAYHLEQAAHQFRTLGRVDVRSRALSARAGQWLSTAGLRALARDDMSAAANLLARAADVLPQTDPARPTVQRELARALLQLGRYEEAEALLSAAQSRASETGDTALAELASLDRQFVRLQFDPDNALKSLVHETDLAYARLTEARNHEGLSAIWRLRAELHFMSCAYGATTKALEHALRHARLAEDRRQENGITIWLASCLALGPTPVPEAIATCTDLIKRAEGSRRVEAAVHTVLGYLHALAGDALDTRLHLKEALGRYDELGLAATRAQWSVYSGTALLLIGDPEAAEGELRTGYDLLRDMGERSTLPTVAAYLARVLVARGRVAEALELTEESQRDASPDDLASQIAWRVARAQCLILSGDPVHADALARSALALAEGTDDVELEAFAHTVLARALAEVGDRAGAALEDQAAASCSRAKGHEPASAGLGPPATEPG